MVQLKIKATHAHPDLVFNPIPPANLSGDQVDIDRVGAAEATNQVAFNNAVNKRNRKIKHSTFNANFYHKKLLDQKQAERVHDLSPVA